MVRFSISSWVPVRSSCAFGLLGKWQAGHPQPSTINCQVLRGGDRSGGLFAFGLARPAGGRQQSNIVFLFFEPQLQIK